MNPARSNGRAPARTVFVGNIPYEYTEEQLADIFKEVGPVQSIRLMFDRETGKPRGYGFCEFFDAETASSAVRNYRPARGRPLRVDFADIDMSAGRPVVPANAHEAGHGPPGAAPAFRPPHDERARYGGTGAGAGGSGSGPAPPANVHDSTIGSSGLHGMPGPTGPPPPGPAHPPATEVIAQLLAGMNQAQLIEVVGQLKGLAASQPAQVRTLLQQNPQLGYAVLDCLVKLGMVDTAAIQRAQASASVVPQAPAQPPPIPAPAAPVYDVNVHQQQHPTPPPPPMAATPTPDALQQQQQAALMQLLSLTQQQIDQLPPDQRATVMQLRSQLGANQA